MIKILLGTHNTAKVKYYEQILSGLDVALVTPGELHIVDTPREEGRNPKENAMIKAAFYGEYADYAIGQDAALYIRGLPFHDPRQPGLWVRRAPDGHERTDAEMIEDYAALAHSLGGRMTCFYLDGWAVCAHGVTKGFMDTGAVNDVYAFDMVDRPHEGRHPGWPLDSLSINRRTGRYFVEPNCRADETRYTAQEKQVIDAYTRSLRAFLVGCLGLEETEREEA